MAGVSKQFGGIKALTNVSMDVNRGEVLALVGENGAGKSTLIKILSGVYQRDSGSIVFNGQPVGVESPRKAEELGISVIHQELPMVSGMSVAENFFLGREPLKGDRGLLDWKMMYNETSRHLQALGVSVDVKAPVRQLGMGHQQMIAIARALARKASLVIMDEPTSSLTKHESERLFETIENLKRQGITIVYISHRIEEIFRLSDRIAVLRDGQHVGTVATRNTSADDVLKMMVGRELKEKFPKQPAPIGDDVLVVRDFGRGAAVKDCSFTARRGEILGCFGLVGAGRTELARLLFGADKADRGTVRLAGRELDMSSPRSTMRAGLCLVPEDRKGQGLILGMAIRENVSLPCLARFARGGLVRASAERSAVAKMVDSLRIRCSGVEQRVRDLSGGNQQKVVVAKWLLSEFDVIIFDEPTRGIDVGAKVEIYHLVNDLVQAGKCVIMISSEMEEILGMCDRVLVMHEGSIGAEFPRSEATPERIMYYATGGR